MFQAKPGSRSLDHDCREMSGDLGVPQTIHEDAKHGISNQPVEEHLLDERSDGVPFKTANLMGLSDVNDEFFDVPEPGDYVSLENAWSGGSSPEFRSPVLLVKR